MAMSPQELERFTKLEAKVAQMATGEDVAFVKSLIRRIFRFITVADLPPIKLSDLSDVENTDTATTGQVLKKTSTTWQPGTDNTGP